MAEIDTFIYHDTERLFALRFPDGRLPRRRRLSGRISQGGGKLTTFHQHGGGRNCFESFDKEFHFHKRTFQLIMYRKV